MPLIIEGGRIPPRWLETNRQPGTSGYPAPSVRIAFINNMPDAALEDTEHQFFDLLHAAAGALPVSVKLFSLAGVCRGERAQQHLANFYTGCKHLLNDHYDGMIMTGTEPKQPNLRQEPYWQPLASILDWAETNTSSVILSCLAAHAGVLHSDGINRHPLSDKQFGVFDFTKQIDHQLTLSAGQPVRFPHSRWNEVRAAELTASGYHVLTASPDGGVDSFVKKKKQSLFVHFQGHPEYSALTLLKEYRRDIKRFLRHERETYPTMPKGYFIKDAAKLLTAFQEVASAARDEALIEDFPQAAIAASLQNTWRDSAVSIYRNWLQYLVARKADAPLFTAMAPARQIATPLTNEVA
ncbi:MAG TPA: homoserine O-succinyltransferase [Terriglobales bacterium]